MNNASFLFSTPNYGATITLKVLCHESKKLSSGRSAGYITQDLYYPCITSGPPEEDIHLPAGSLGQDRHEYFQYFREIETMFKSILG
jgi:hypothetical protein